MKVVFRTDASLQIGTGHVMRCLTLADSLRQNGADCVFVCRLHTGHLLDLITQRGFCAIALSGVPPEGFSSVSITEPTHAIWLGVDWRSDAQDTLKALDGVVVDWVVVDHYALDSKWEECVRPYCKKIMVIDDLADRKHNCDLLLDQNLHRQADDYYGLLPITTTGLIGPRYALLRPEFFRQREYSLARRLSSGLKHLLINMGGVDKDNVTGQVLSVLQDFPSSYDLDVTVVMGHSAPWLSKIQAQAAQMRFHVRVLAGVDDMACIMAENDLAIGAAGSTSWERCCLGLPTIMLVLADNQREVAAGLERAGAAILLEQKDIAQQLPFLLVSFFNSPGVLTTMSQAAANIVDGDGVEAVVALLMPGRGAEVCV